MSSFKSLYSSGFDTTRTVNPRLAIRSSITRCIGLGLQPVDLNSTKITVPPGNRYIRSGSPLMNWDSNLIAIPPLLSTYLDIVRSNTFSLFSVDFIRWDSDMKNCVISHPARRS